jgi:hypothetical protein
VIHRLFDSYTETCFYGLMEDYPEEHSIHFIRAGKNAAWTRDVLHRFEGMRK